MCRFYPGKFVAYGDEKPETQAEIENHVSAFQSQLFERPGPVKSKQSIMLRHIVFTTNNSLSALRHCDHCRADITYSIMIYILQTNHEIPSTRFSSSSGLKVDLLLLPFNFFVTALFRDRLSSRLFASSASASACSNFCWIVRAGDKAVGCVCMVGDVRSCDLSSTENAYLKGDA